VLPTRLMRTSAGQEKSQLLAAFRSFEGKCDQQYSILSANNLKIEEKIDF